MSAAQKKESHHNADFVRQAIGWLHSATMDQALDFYHSFIQDKNCDDWTIAEIGKRDPDWFENGQLEAAHLQNVIRVRSWLR